MSELYEQYLLEREDTHVKSNDSGFATYKYGPDYVYIVDIYVLPELRQSGLASALADQICSEAVEKGKTRMIGTVDLEANGKTQSCKALLGYGFELDSCDGKMIYFVKEIKRG